eukprot:CAMPEP_0196579584 /NCGR_PEP_ID=MMETSP1081-20130531/23141_1 /TAXON_ID=36882 /ORGANISM="Pyramimonas amylifera, Strain CCMP720" /LENGTH=290 /DNA_ID=CAMNT_0041899213 /DNA_START=179 /DNA_END=1048 /DNA_ORIENTATION=-
MEYTRGGGFFPSGESSANSARVEGNGLCVENILKDNRCCSNDEFLPSIDKAHCDRRGVLEGGFCLESRKIDHELEDKDGSTTRKQIEERSDFDKLIKSSNSLDDAYESPTQLGIVRSDIQVGRDGDKHTNDVRCNGCGSRSNLDDDFRSAFGKNVCRGCAHTAGSFSLISKASAKQTFLLSDSDLAPLSFIARKNPHHKAWNPMKLYLKSQVSKVALDKWGSLEEMEAERHCNVEKRVLKSEDRKRQYRRECQQSERAKGVRARLETPTSQDHVHTFSEPLATNEDLDVW